MAGTRTIDKQRIAFEDITWTYPTINLASAAPASGTYSTLPRGTKSGDPYWTFKHELSPSFGLKITDVIAVNTQPVSSGSSVESVLTSIEFLELSVTFTDGSTSNFDISKAFSNTDSQFISAEQGTMYGISSYNPYTTPDTLFQRGVYLKLVDTFNETCKVTVELSAVFRGSMADFDPGNVPEAMKIYPHASFAWESIGTAGKKVKSFHCLIKTTLMNTMFMASHSHSGGMTMGNTAGFYTDSNTAMTTDSDRQLSSYRYWGTQTAWWSKNLIKKPFGWALVFDYLGKLSTETEILAVHGPLDPFYASKRTGSYAWGTGTMHVDKVERQGQYDNIHVHALMGNDIKGNPQIHAPFCGHSCVHMHWRWSSTSSNGAENPERGPTYKGWSKSAFITSNGTTTKYTATAFSLENAPLIPPTHRLVVAVTNTSATRFSNANIINPSTTGAPLDPLNKCIWYDVTILNAAPRIKHVVMEHGFGWAYKYSWASSAVQRLAGGPIPPATPFVASVPTQQELSDYFEQKIYPIFRYFDASDLTVTTDEQIPTGDYTGGSTTKMKDL